MRSSGVSAASAARAIAMRSMANGGSVVSAAQFGRDRANSARGVERDARLWGSRWHHQRRGLRVCVPDLDRHDALCRWPRVARGRRRCTVLAPILIDLCPQLADRARPPDRDAFEAPIEQLVGLPGGSAATA